MPGFSKTGFPERLKEARLRLDMTQDQLAAQLNVTKASVSGWENGREKPGFRLLDKLREVLGVSLDELVCGDDLAEDAGRAPLTPQVVTVQSPDEVKLLNGFRRMSEKQRQGLLAMIGYASDLDGKSED